MCEDSGRRPHGRRTDSRLGPHGRRTDSRRDPHGRRTAKSGKEISLYTYANINSQTPPGRSQVSGFLQWLSFMKNMRTWKTIRSILLFGYTASLWLFFLLLACLRTLQKLKTNLNGQWQKHSHRTLSSFSLVLYYLDVFTDIYTLYKTKPKYAFMRYIGATIIALSSLISSIISYYPLHKRWSTSPSTKRWYHYLIYTPIGFILLPFCILFANTKRAWQLERKQFEDEIPKNVNFVIITESLFEGSCQFILQLGFISLESGEEDSFTKTIAWYRWVSVFLSLLSTARGASLVLQMKLDSQHTPSSLRIVYLMFTIAFRSISFMVTGCHAKVTFADIPGKGDAPGYAAFMCWIVMGIILDIIPGVLILVKEVPCSGIGHAVWTVFRIAMGHYLLDMVTPYGLVYSLIQFVFSICILLWGKISPFTFIDDEESYADPMWLDEKVAVYGIVLITSICLLFNIIMFIITIFRVGSIGKCLRDLWIDLKITTEHTPDNAEIVKIENGKMNEEQNKYLYSILHLFSTVYEFITK